MTTLSFKIRNLNGYEDDLGFKETNEKHYKEDTSLHVSRTTNKNTIIMTPEDKYVNIKETRILR